MHKAEGFYASAVSTWFENLGSWIRV